MQKVRVRFAPSPTGYLHVGGLRTALYNFLYARRSNGAFVIRIEDTDRSRFVEGATESLLKAIEALQLTYDEGPNRGGDFAPYFQSERTDLYRKYAEELVNNGYAYHCFCSSETLTEMREKQKANKEMIRYDRRCRDRSDSEREGLIESGKPFVIRAKIPLEGYLQFDDKIRGSVSFPWDMVDDQVLIKSDGYPTYHLANVVDDHLMEISDVIRGEEWLSSTPKHIFLYNAFNWTPPEFAHLPLLLNPDKSKLSKRQGDVAVEDFLEKGYLPEALINFVALLGWHDSNDRELFTLKELQEVFSLERINKAGAVFDIEKLKWMNGQYLRAIESKALAERLKPYCEEAGLDITDAEKYLKVIEFAKERITLLPEIVTEIEMFYRKPEFSAEDIELLKGDKAQQVLGYWLDLLKDQTEMTGTHLESLIKKTSTDLGVKGKELYFPLRLAFYGKVHGPNIPVLIDILGREEAITRLVKALD